VTGAERPEPATLPTGHAAATSPDPALTSYGQHAGKLRAVSGQSDMATRAAGGTRGQEPGKGRACPLDAHLLLRSDRRRSTSAAPPLTYSTPWPGKTPTHRPVEDHRTSIRLPRSQNQKMRNAWSRDRLERGSVGSSTGRHGLSRSTSLGRRGPADVLPDLLGARAHRSGTLGHTSGTPKIKNTKKTPLGDQGTPWSNTIFRKRARMDSNPQPSDP